MAATVGIMWTAIAGSGTMTDLSERVCYECRINLDRGRLIYWTTDGTSSGDPLFSAAKPIAVRVLSEDPYNNRAYTMSMCQGPMLRPEYLNQQRPYIWRTYQDTGLWVTEAVGGGFYAGVVSGTTRGGTYGTGSKRVAVVKAFGAGYVEE